MCGIAGMVRYDDSPIPADWAAGMLAQLAHRGPDQRGTSRHHRCVLAHTRLAVIDLSQGGGQPMHLPPRGDDSALSVVFNGEIYNHRQLRRQLQDLGHRFVTDHADTEVLLHGYRQWGEALPEHLEGMFAFALWIEAQRSVYLCRDRMGKKPLFVRRRENELVFASLPGLLATAQPRLNRDALHTFLQLGYTTHESLLDGVSELPAAHWVRFDGQGRQTTGCYWRPAPAEHSADLMRTLDAAVAKRLEADVPLGCFLSGGLDSSLVAALARRHVRQLRTFCVAVPAAGYDESEHARAVARHIGSQHTELTAGAADVESDLRALIEQTGEPMGDSSVLPTYWLCKAARSSVRVALSGDGGDELFGGYDRYRAMRLLSRHRWWLSRVPAGALRRGSERSRLDRLRRLSTAARAPDPQRQYRAMLPLLTDEQLRELGGFDARPLPDWPDAGERLDPARAAMAWDQRHYLPFDLLRKLDRASMAVALEVRCPLLDPAVAAQAARLEPAQLFHGRLGKSALRQLAAQLLPPRIARRPKRGFALPLGQWFRSSLRQAITDALSGGGLESLGLVPGPAQRLLGEHLRGEADHTHRLFALWSLCLWSRRLTSR